MRKINLPAAEDPWAPLYRTISWFVIACALVSFCTSREVLQDADPRTAPLFYTATPREQLEAPREFEVEALDPR